MTDQASSDQSFAKKEKRASLRVVAFFAVAAGAGVAFAIAVGVFPPLYRPAPTCDNAQAKRMAEKLISDRSGIPEHRILISLASSLESRDGWTRCLVSVSEAGKADPAVPVEMRIRRSDSGDELLVTISPVG